MSIDYNDMHNHEVMFSHADNDTRKVTHIAVDRLRNFLLCQDAEKPNGWSLAKVDVNEKDASFMKENNGIEAHRLKRLTKEHIENSFIILIHWGDGEHTIADGNHRYVRAFQLGIKGIRAIIVEPSIWRMFEVTGLPVMAFEDMDEIIKTMPSGIM